MKKKALNILLAVLIIATLGIFIWGLTQRKKSPGDGYNDGIEQVDLNTIRLQDSGVEVNFSDVILSKPEEERKLIICRQNSEIGINLTNNLIKQLNFEILKKTQSVHYQGEGYFVVDLDNLTKDNIVEDKEKKTITIFINHAHLETVDIDPEKIKIGDVQNGFLNWGEITLSLKDLNEIEKEIVNRMREEFNTVENGQEADATALKIVKEIYEPIVKALDKEYSVDVRFKE